MRVTQNFDSVHTRHLDIGDNHVKQRTVDFALGHFSAGNGFYLVAIAAQSDIKEFANRALVIADKNVTHARFLLLPHLLLELPTQFGWIPGSKGLLRPRPGHERGPARAHEHGPCSAAGPRNSCLCQLPSAPTPYPRGPAQSGKQSRDRGRFPLQSSTGTA